MSPPSPLEEDLGLLLEEPSSSPVLGGIWARILSGVDALERFAPYAPQVASALQVDVHQARRALHGLSDKQGWVSIVPPGIRIRPMVVGAEASRQEVPGAMFAEILPGGGVPTHRHHGAEVMVVLQGYLCDVTRSGEIFEAGSVLASEDGSVHALQVPLEPAIPCLCLVVNAGWIEFLELA
ncbi:MAG: cupin domain-containing protein [Myxococcales bacterium]|nr:cupin domain-containing protein [Polyangiaceae bacterium]MDW8248822.1 cupin domain-containing protein [Myxococcales bacterium]